MCNAYGFGKMERKSCFIFIARGFPKSFPAFYIVYLRMKVILGEIFFEYFKIRVVSLRETKKRRRAG